MELTDYLILISSITLFAVLPIGIFILFHSQPLTEKEVIQLAKKRRQRQIRRYFFFERYQLKANIEFKRRMNPNGEFYPVNEYLTMFPAIAAALFKYKKHEWIIIAFEKNMKINKFWLSKGNDRSSVLIPLSPESVARIAYTDGDSSVLILHNHPNGNPTYYSYTQPSAHDIISAEAYARVLAQNGTNLLEFICERGMHYQYFQSIADDFLRLSEFVCEIEAMNHESSLKNLKLHLERIFN